MNYLVTSSTLILFALFYQASGGADFVPRSERTVATTDSSKSTLTQKRQTAFVPFDQPIIIAKEVEDDILVAAANADPVNTGGDFQIIQAAVALDGTPAAPPQRQDIRIVAGEWVNLRAGPGTSFDVLDTLPQGVEAEVLQVNDADWAQIRLIETNETGWMAVWLLSD